MLPTHPLIYEINTWAWLTDLANGREPLSLAEVPSSAWDHLASLGLDAVWFMGVWERSPRGRRIALDNHALVDDFRSLLPDFSEEDVIGSAYCVRNYRVDPALGGDEALAVARADLKRRGIGLILDFVPNHTALDHPWTTQHPEYYLCADEAALAADPEAFSRVDGTIIANGRDPYFPAWTDVAQLNAFSPAYRHAARELLARLATMCDGVRCDMAMLLTNRVFPRTWDGLADPVPETEFWEEVMPAAREANPEFRFIAEVYWDMERALQAQGFDFCYDKRLYDHLIHGPGPAVRDRLGGDASFQERLVRFVENHDEHRAAAAFPPHRLQAALVLTMAAPGAMLLHDGQMEGRRLRLPVQLGRRPSEPVDEAMRTFHAALLAEHGAIFRKGSWRLCPTSGWEDNQSHANLAAFAWEHDRERRLVVVNLSEEASQGYVQTGWEGLTGEVLFTDTLQGTSFRRKGPDLAALYVDLPGFGYHFLRLEH